MSVDRITESLASRTFVVDHSRSSSDIANPKQEQSTATSSIPTFGPDYYVDFSYTAKLTQIEAKGRPFNIERANLGEPAVLTIIETRFIDTAA